MPKKGFVSLTVKESIYDSFQEIFKENKTSLEKFGINSLTGFLTFVLNDVFSRDILWNQIMTDMAGSRSGALKELMRKQK